MERGIRVWHRLASLPISGCSPDINVRRPTGRLIRTLAIRSMSTPTARTSSREILAARRKAKGNVSISILAEISWDMVMGFIKNKQINITAIALFAVLLLPLGCGTGNSNANSVSNIRYLVPPDTYVEAWCRPQPPRLRHREWTLEFKRRSRHQPH